MAKINQLQIVDFTLPDHCERSFSVGKSTILTLVTFSKSFLHSEFYLTRVLGKLCSYVANGDIDACPN